LAVASLLGIAQWCSPGLRSGWSGVRLPVGTRNFSPHYSCFHTGSGAHPASYPVGTSGAFPGDKSGRSVKLTTHLHLVTRSRMRRTIPPLPDTPSWRGAQLKESTATNLPYCYTYYCYYPVSNTKKKCLNHFKIVYSCLKSSSFQEGSPTQFWILQVSIYLTAKFQSYIPVKFM
jgi:hypothetical protein